MAPLRPRHFMFGEYAKFSSQFATGSTVLGYRPPSLNNSTLVVVPVDGVRPPPQSTFGGSFCIAKCCSKNLVLDVTDEQETVITGRIEPEDLECGVVDGRHSSQVSHHPGRVKPLPALPVENSGGTRATAPPIELKVPDTQSCLGGRKIKQPARIFDILLFSYPTFEYSRL